MEAVRSKGIFSTDDSGIAGVVFPTGIASKTMLLLGKTGGEKRNGPLCDGGCSCLSRGVVGLFPFGNDSPDLDSESVGKESNVPGYNARGGELTEFVGVCELPKLCADCTTGGSWRGVPSRLRGDMKVGTGFDTGGRGNEVVSKISFSDNPIDSSSGKRVLSC